MSFILKWRLPRWEQAKLIYSELAIGKESAPLLAFGRIKRQVEEWESFIVKTEEGFIYALIGGSCHEEAGGELFTRTATCVIDWWSIIGLFWLVLSWKLGQNLGKLSIIDQMLIVVGRLLQRLWFNFYDWLLWNVSNSVLFLSVVCLYTQSLLGDEHLTTWEYEF